MDSQQFPQYGPSQAQDSKFHTAELRDPPILTVTAGRSNEEDLSSFPSVTETWLLIYPANKIICEADRDNSQLGNPSAIRKGERMLVSFLMILYDTLGHKETGQHKDNPNNPRTGTAYFILHVLYKRQYG